MYSSGMHVRLGFAISSRAASYTTEARIHAQCCSRGEAKQRDRARPCLLETAIALDSIGPSSTHWLIVAVSEAYAAAFSGAGLGACSEGSCERPVDQCHPENRKWLTTGHP